MDGLNSTQLSPIKADRHQSQQSRPQSDNNDGDEYADDDYDGDYKSKLINHIKVDHKLLMSMLMAITNQNCQSHLSGPQNVDDGEVLTHHIINLHHHQRQLD